MAAKNACKRISLSHFHRLHNGARRHLPSWFLFCAVIASGQAAKTKWAIAVHGGAGESEWRHMDSVTEAAYHASLSRALNAGVTTLSRRGKSLDAVEAAIKVLEDDPLFSAGRGSAFNDQGKNGMDASIMDGSTLAAGSVAGVCCTKNPILAARAVMERSPYV